jgi:hypothetical protein
VLTYSGTSAGGRARRRPAAGTTGGVTPVSLQLGPGNKRKGELQGVLGKVGVVRVDGDNGRRMELAVGAKAAAMAACGGSASREEGRRRPFYRQARDGGRRFLRAKVRGLSMGSGTVKERRGGRRRAAASGPMVARQCAGQRVNGERVALASGSANVMCRSSRGGAWTGGC